MCTDQEVGLEEREHQAEPFNVIHGACSTAGNFRLALQHQRLQAATSRWFIAFALEGLPLDLCHFGLRNPGSFEPPFFTLNQKLL